MAGCAASPRATASEPGSSSPGHHHLSDEVNALAHAADVPTRSAYVDALVEAVMAQDVLSVLLALRVLCAKGLLYSGKTGVNAKNWSQCKAALELQMRQADSPHGRAILQLLFLNLDGCLEWKPFDGPLYHHGPLKKWARAALQAFKKDKGRSSTLGRSILRTTDDKALRCLLRANALERRTAQASDPLRETGSGLDRERPSSAQVQSGRAEAVRGGDKVPVEEEIEAEVATTEPTRETTLDPLDSVHQHRMDYCTSRRLDLGPVSHYVRSDPYPTPSLSPPPVSPPQPVEGQDERPRDSEVAPQRSALNRPSGEENLPQPFPPPSDRRTEAKLPPPPPPPSEPLFFALPTTTTTAASRKRSASPSPVGWVSPLLPPPPPEKRNRLVHHPLRKHVRWAAQEFVVLGSGAGHVAEEDLYCEVDEGGCRSRPRVAARFPIVRGAAWAPPAALRAPPRQRAAEEGLEADRLLDHHAHAESTSRLVKPPPATTTSSAVPSSWTAWYNDCFDPV